MLNSQFLDHVGELVESKGDYMSTTDLPLFERGRRVRHLNGVTHHHHGSLPGAKTLSGTGNSTEVGEVPRSSKSLKIDKFEQLCHSLGRKG